MVNGYHQNTQLAASRSFFGMTGILLALVIPQWLANKYGRTVGLSYYSLVFVPILLACLLLVVRKTESPPIKPINQPIGSHIFLPLRNKNFLRLIIVFFLSGMSSAIPGLLILFFVSDILKAPEWGWLAILIYFLTSAIAIPFWANLTKKIGKKKVWLMGMLSAVFSFFWAFFLEDGDIGIFIFICALSGFANGSEITIPVSILADLINKNNVKERSTANASYFGLWQMIEKANLGIAAGVCLPILGVWGYEPNTTESNNFALIAMYSLFPCVIKTFAIITLYYFSIEHDSDKIDT